MRILADGHRARMALDLTADVVTLEGPVESIHTDADVVLAVAYMAATGFEARQMFPTLIMPAPHADPLGKQRASLSRRG